MNHKNSMDGVCRNILIIDSADAESSCYSALESELDSEVKIVRSGDEALKAVKECRPEIVIMDLSLPDINGIKLLEKINSFGGLSTTKVLLFSSGIDEETAVKGLSLGACDFIRKPISGPELNNKVKNIIGMISRENEIEKLNAQLRLEKDKAEKERNLIAKFISKDLIEQILNGDIPATLGGEIKIASILFCDLRNSTEMAEKIEPDLFSKFLSNLFIDITDIIYGEGGSVNKFMGDGILATFGVPKFIEDDVFHCSCVAVKIRKYLLNFNQFRPMYLDEPVSMGIGIARGRLFIGNIGSVNNMEYTVLGDPVNLASRLESLTKKVKVDILIDGNTRRSLGKKAKVKKVKNVKIRGKQDDVEVYYLEDLII